ncbi:MAG: transcription factor TFIIIC [Candidatus Nezhaarchaeota archaeon]|nr:transcription factor TFIIIC [Candidatus Nezhaarchaeota archaeon]
MKKREPESLCDKVLELIKKSGPQGMLQRDLWKRLKVSSREGSRLVSALERKGLIVREPITRGRLKTFKLMAVSHKLEIVLESVRGCPCFSCMNLVRCGSGQYVNPEKCEDLTAWLLKDEK